MEFLSVPHEVPLTVSEPELVEALAPKNIATPIVSRVPFTAVPVMVKFPAPVDEMLLFEARATPPEPLPVPHEVPLTVSDPELVVTAAADAETP